MKGEYKLKVACVISGGKDGLFAYHELLKKDKDYEVKMFINLNAKGRKVSFHEYRKELVVMQAEAIGLPLMQHEIVCQHKNREQFEIQLEKILSELKKVGIDGVAFGYILMGDYQDQLLQKICAKIGLKLILPNYGKNSEEVLKNLIESGIRAIITTVDSEKIKSKWLGHSVDNKFFDYLKKQRDVDFCGDKGEYHTFVVDAPFFRKKFFLKNHPKIIYQTETAQTNGILRELHLQIDHSRLMDKNVRSYL